jgi:carbonic anhydrase
MYTHTAEIRDLLTPADALQILKDGNARFGANLKANRNLLQQVSETSDGQWPFAVVLSCIDSRTSTELVFDQGLGDIFSIWIAGNFINDDILGSMEFACHVAGAKLVVVLGHSHCGAIKGACDQVELGLLSGMLRKIQPSVEAVTTPTSAEERRSTNPSFVAAVSRENVLHSMQGILERSDVLSAMNDAGTIDVVGGMYDVITGSVEFFARAEEGAVEAQGGETLLLAANQRAAEKHRLEDGESEPQRLATVSEPASSAGTTLSSNPRFLDDVRIAVERAPSWKPWSRSTNARSLALVWLLLLIEPGAFTLINVARRYLGRRD